MNLGCVVKANRCSESQRRWLVLRLPFVEQKNTSAYCTLLEAGWADAGERLYVIRGRLGRRRGGEPKKIPLPGLEPGSLG